MMAMKKRSGQRFGDAIHRHLHRIGKRSAVNYLSNLTPTEARRALSYANRRARQAKVQRAQFAWKLTTALIDTHVRELTHAE